MINNFKSLNIVAIIFISTSFFLSSCNKEPVKPTSDPGKPYEASKEASVSNGRFQFIVNPQFRSEAVILDTATGKIWQRTCIVPGRKGIECDYSAWTTQDIEDVTMSGKDIWDHYYNSLKK